MPLAPVGKPFISKKQRRELKELCDATTPGPWKVRSDGGRRDAVRGRISKDSDDLDIDPVCQIIRESIWGNEDDIFLMAASREAIPKLLSEIDRLEGKLARRERTVRPHERRARA